MKIRLIEPAPPGVHVFSKLKFARLGLPIIGATLRDHGHDVLIYVEDLAPIIWSDISSSDLVGISCTTSTATKGYEIADRIRLMGIKVIIGGAHVTFMPEEALEHADFVARGEGGEKIMLELISALEGHGSYDAISGLSYKRNGFVKNNTLRNKTENLDELPFPDLTLIQGNERFSSTPIMTSWGCPYNCNFCSVTAMFGKEYRFRSPENIIAELEEKKPTNVFFYDDNFAADVDRLKVLLRMIIAKRNEGLKFRWSAQVRADVARDPELVDLMALSGCWQVYIGLESINPETLKIFKKAQTVKQIGAAVEILGLHGIKTHGMFVLGADTDSKECVKKTVDFALEHKISTIMLNILTPIPGTPLYRDICSSGRMITPVKWEHFDAHHVVFMPRQMTPYELQARVIAGYARFYSLPRLVKAVLTLNKVKIMLSAWGYSTVRSWRKDLDNKDYVKKLKNWRRKP